MADHQIGIPVHQSPFHWPIKTFDSVDTNHSSSIATLCNCNHFLHWPTGTLDCTSITDHQFPCQMTVVPSLFSLATGKKSPQTQQLKKGIKIVCIALLITDLFSDDSSLFLADIMTQHDFPVNNHSCEQKSVFKVTM